VTYTEIEPSEIKRRLANGETLTMIDVREYDEVAQGMIPGAVHIPLGELPARIGEIEQAGEIILICRSGARSGRACEYLAMRGMQGVKNMAGGMLKWYEIN
jgi:rhodanese-related sulfurtransferase